MYTETKLVIPEKLFTEIQSLAIRTNEHSNLKKLITKELQLAYNIGLNQGMIEAMAKLKKELDLDSK